MLIMLLVLHDLPFMVSHIFGPDPQVAVDHDIYHGLSTFGDLLFRGRNVTMVHPDKGETIRTQYKKLARDSNPEIQET